MAQRSATASAFGWCVVAVCVAFFWARPAAGDSTLAVYPPRIQLDNARDFQRFIVVNTRPDGVTVDVTGEVQVTIAPEGMAVISEDGKIRPAKDGEGTFTVAWGGQTVSIPMKVLSVGASPPVSFRNDVEPAIMRAGCNVGTCHGSAQGKNGFRLSLFGFDPKMDYLHLTRQSRGRRLDASKPDESLMILKPTGLVAHEGGSRLEKDDAIYTVLRQWIVEGAKDDPPDLTQLTGIEVLPPSAVLEGEGATHQFIVQAYYADGSDRDVTEFAVMAAEDALTVQIDDGGLATSGGRGESYIMARYGSFAEITQVISIPKGIVPVEGALAPKNYVDELVYAKHKKLRLVSAKPCSDEVFVRRVYIDIAGILPTGKEALAFLADTGGDKRSRLIDTLLDRPEFTELWAMKWAEVLRVKSSPQTLDPKAMHRYNDWLRQAVTENKPIDELVEELLTAQGGNFTSPAANFYVVESNPTKVAENVAQVFMGIQVQCAQCHDHPFERWTMDDYYSFAAFFSQIGRKNSSDPREKIVYDTRSGEVKNIRDGRVMAPKFLGGATPDVSGKDRRAVLAKWLVSPENAWFAKNFANRVWAQFMGRGIVDPPDDSRTTNPPSNPELLEELGRRFIDYGYDFRKLIRDICNSNTYQLDTKPFDESMSDDRNFTHAPIRRLPAEQLLDAISQVTGTKVKFASLPLGARAVQVADGNTGNYFLTVFGRPARDSVCTCERRNEPTLAQTLHLINGDTVNAAIRDGNNRLSKALAAETPPETIVEELYVAAYSRKPRAEERRLLLEYIAKAEDTRAALEDTYWSVLNSKEFIFNH